MRNEFLVVNATAELELCNSHPRYRSDAGIIRRSCWKQTGKPLH
jgi:hypothetical protein